MAIGGQARSVGVWIVAALAVLMQAAYGNNWPIGDGSTPQPIYSTYGQYYEWSGGLHLHEGLDILGPVGTPVYARASGTIVGLNKASGLLILETSPYTHTGFNYAHIQIGQKPTGGVWQEGDMVAYGNMLGTVMAIPDHPSHLHIDIGAGADPYFSTSGPPKNQVRQPTMDPLESFYPPWSPLNPAPVVSGDIRFRIADHDRNGQLYPEQNGPLEVARDDNLYFIKRVDGAPVVGRYGTTYAANGTYGAGSPDIDIIAMAYDCATATFHGGSSSTRNTPLSMALRIQGQQNSVDTGLHTIYEFQGMYLQEEWVHGYSMMRDSEARWTRTIYSNDVMTDSRDVADPYEELRGTYWFQMTNYDGDQLVEVGPPGSALDDRGRYWNSDGAKGTEFYQNPLTDLTPADALWNAEADFPDGFYDITVVAKDHGGLTGSATCTVLLDNWKQYVGVSQPCYPVYMPIHLSEGGGFPASASIGLHLLDAMPRDGQELPAPWQTARTDAMGVLMPIDLDPLSVMGTYYLVADYNADGLFHGPLDGLTTFAIVPEPVSLALLGLGLCLLARRGRVGGPGQN